MMNLKRLGKRWYIVGDEGLIGPYDTKAEAEEDRRGLRRFERFEDEPGYVTSDTVRMEDEEC